MSRGRQDHSWTLDFYLANGTGQSIRVTLWGGLGDDFIEKKTSNVGMYPVILTAMNAKHYNNFLSSSSSTQILDDPQIHELKELKVDNSEGDGSLNQVAVHVDYSQPENGTLENLLIWARNRKNEVSLFLFTVELSVRIDNIRTRKGWNFPSGGGEKCKKGVEQKEGSFWCELCNKNVEYPVLRFRLKLDVFYKTSSTMVVMFYEPATGLVKCSADSIANADDEYLHVIYPGIVFRVDLEDSDDEVTCAPSDGPKDAKDRSPSEKRKKDTLWMTLPRTSQPKFQ
ncbi:nucleic acid-binding, OB-fold protein [Tanacetum coccineum]